MSEPSKVDARQRGHGRAKMMLFSDPQFPRPPDDISISGHVRKEWEQMLESAKTGGVYKARLARLEAFLEERVQLIEDRELRAEYDWAGDWLWARSIHDVNLDHAAWLDLHRQGLQRSFERGAAAIEAYALGASQEGFKAILLVHGATALASLAVLSGEVTNAASNIWLAASIALIGSIVGIVMAAIGQIIGLHFAADARGQLTGMLTPTVKLRRMYAFSRYFSVSLRQSST